MSKSKQANKYISFIIGNIFHDRDITLEMLDDLRRAIGSKDEQIKSFEGAHGVASKYLESLQRSNEQLVKLLAIMERKVEDENGDLSDGEKDALYDQITEDKKS